MMFLATIRNQSNESHRAKSADTDRYKLAICRTSSAVNLEIPFFLTFFKSVSNCFQFGSHRAIQRRTFIKFW